MGKNFVDKLKDYRLVMLLAFVLVTFFANISVLPTDIMESRNIVTGREMVSDGNWLVPTMNGELRLEKPPLPTWVAGLMEMIAPGSMTAQRCAAGVMGVLWTAFLFLLANYISRRRDFALVSTVVFLTCYNLILMGRSATWDIYCHAFMMAAVYFLTRALCENCHTHRRFALAGLFLGLSFLSKGPVSFYTILLPYLIVLVAFLRPSIKGKWAGLAMMLFIMIAVGSWWYIYLLSMHPEESTYVFHKESSSWANHNVRPWWYYWQFFLEMGVWAILMLAALAVSYWKRHITMKREYLIFFTWSVACLALLSLMPEKKTRYLLPLLAPCSLLVGTLVMHFCQGKPTDKFSRWLFPVNGWIVVCVVVAIPVLGYFLGVRKGIISIPAETVIAIADLAIACIMVHSIVRWHPARFIACIAAVFAVIELLMLPVVGSAVGNPEARSIHLIHGNEELKDVPFYHSADEPLRIELVYEAGRKILPLDISDSATVMQHLPMAVVTRQPLEKELPASVLGKVEIHSYGLFDDNKLPRNHRHYIDDFLNYVSLVSTKE